jgi:PAS domain S-box-containing protein
LPEEILAMPDFISTVIAKEDRALFTERFGEAIQGTSGENFEFRYLHRNGTKHWLNVSWQPIVDMNGNSLGTRASGHDITGRKHAEEALRTSEEKYRKAFFTSPNAICITRLHDGMFISINKGFTEITGYTEEDVAGKTSLEINVWKDQEDRRKIVEKLKAEGEVRNYEARFLTKTGEITGLMSTLIIELDGVPHILNITHDITERKVAEEAHRINEERLQMAQDIGHMGCWEYDIKTSQMWGSEEGCHLFGFPRKAGYFPVEAFASCITEPELVLKAFNDLIDEGKEYNLDFVINPKDGSAQRTLHSIGILEKDEHGNPIKVRGINQDITERKRAEEALLESKERFKNLIETISDWVWEVDQTGKYTYVSPKIRDILGYEPDEVIGKTPFELMPPEESEKVAGIFTGYIISQKPFAGLENINQHKDGRKVVLETSGVPFFDEEHTLLGYRGIDRDITERKVAEQEILKKNEELSASFEQIAATEEELRQNLDEMSKIQSDLVKSEDRFRSVMNHLPGTVWAVDRDLRYTLSQGAGLFPIGLKPDQVIGMTLWEFFGTSDPSHTAISNHIRALNGEEIVYDYTHEGISFRTYLSPLLDTQGNITGLTGLAFNITEQKRAEAAISESFATFKTVMDSLDALVYVADMKTYEILFVNQYGRNIWGDLAGKVCWQSLQTNQNGPCPFCTNEKLMDENGNPSGIVIWEFRNTITGQWYECHDSAIRWTDGRIVRLEIATDITDRKRAEQELHKARDEYVNLLDHIHDVYYRSDAEGNLIQASRSWAKNLGYYDLSECIGKNIAETFYFDPVERRSFLNEVYKNGSVSDYEVTLKKNDGTPLSVATSSYLYFDESGKVLGIEGTWRDITDRKQTEEALAESEEKYRAFFSTSQDFVFITSPEGTFIDFSDAAIETLGYESRDELASVRIKDLYANPAERERHIRAIAGQGFTKEYPLDLKKKDGSLIHTLITSVIRKDHNGNIIGFQGTVRDVTLQKRTEQALRVHAEIERNMSEATYLIRICDSTIVYTNPAFDRLLGYNSGELIGKHVKTVNAPSEKSPEEIASDIISYLKQTGTWAGEVVNLRKDGTTVWCHANVITFNHPKHGNVWLSMHHDITERKRAEKEICESNERYNSLFTNNYSISLLIDPETGMIVDANAAACKYYGYSPEQIREMGIYEINRIDKERVIRNLIRAKKERHFFSTHYLADGKQRNVEIYSGPILVNGKSLFYSIIHDVTDKIKAEEELKNSRRFIEHTLSTTPAIIYNYDVVEQRNVYTNRGIFEALGYTPEEISAMGQDLFSKILHPDDAGPVGQHHASFSILPDSTVAEIEYRMKHADGSWRWLHSRDVVFQRTPDGAVKQILGSSIDITDRKMVEEALRESERRMTDIISFLPDATLVIDKNGTVLAWNRAMEEMTGVPAEQMIGKANYEYALPFYHERRPITVDLVLHDYPAIVEKYPFMLKEDRSRCSEIFIPHLNKGRGAYLWFMASPLYDAHGNLMGAIESIRDITERKQAEEALRLKDFAIESSINAIAITDMSGNLTYVNPAFLSILGYEERQEVLGRSVLSFWMVPDEAQQDVDAIKVQGTLSSEIVGQRKDGTPIQVQLSANLIRDVSGAPVAMMGSFIDITERMQVEEALRESEERYRNVVEDQTEFICRFLPDGTHIFVNDAYCRYFDKKREEIIGQRFRPVLHPEDREMVARHIASITPKHPVMDIDQRIIIPDGSTRWQRWSDRAIFDPNGRVIEYQSVGRDITDRKLAEEALALASKKLTLLSSITRHDINNQMTVLMGYLTILKKKQPDPTFSEYFLKASLAAQRISSMIQFTREYECIGVKAPAWQDCRTLVDTAAKEAPLGQVIVKNDLPAGTEVFSDPLVVKVCYNLMDNAVRYGGKITTIRFTIEERDGNQVVVCEDDGEGVVADEKDKIFERGFGKNTGLGLALAREILDITGITIRETGEPGKGARFEMTVPKGAWRMKGNGA